MRLEVIKSRGPSQSPAPYFLAEQPWAGQLLAHLSEPPCLQPPNTDKAAARLAAKVFRGVVHRTVEMMATGL